MKFGKVGTGILGQFFIAAALTLVSSDVRADLKEVNGCAQLSCPSTGDREGLIQQDRVSISMAGSGPNVFFFDFPCAV